MLWRRGTSGSAGRGAETAAYRHLAALAGYAAVFCALLLPKLLPGEPGRILSNSPADGALISPATPSDIVTATVLRNPFSIGLTGRPGI